MNNGMKGYITLSLPIQAYTWVERRINGVVVSLCLGTDTWRKELLVL